MAHRARFDIIRYSNCWEDAGILLRAIHLRAGGTYLSIASAGDNTLSLLCGDPSRVLAVDISDAQLACLELRRAAFRVLPHGAVLRFLGVQADSGRLRTYEGLRHSLLPDARRFWDARHATIARGIVHAGKFERYFRLFNRWVLPLVHGKRMVEELLSEKDHGARAEFYERKWDTLRWRVLFRVFFSRAVMGRLGRDPEFFKYVKGDVAGRILGRSKYALTELPTHDNPFLTYILTGNFDGSLPHYLEEGNFDAIRKNLDRLSLFRGNVSEALLAHRGALFDGFNLSDIFEYMSYEEFSGELARIVQRASRGGRLVYWNMLADRIPPQELGDRLEPMEGEARELFLRDRAFFYKALRIERVR